MVLCKTCTNATRTREDDVKMNEDERRLLNFMKSYNIPSSKFKKIKRAVLMEYSSETTNENTIYNKMTKKDLAEICVSSL